MTDSEGFTHAEQLQITRERAQREAALGRRVEAAKQGRLSPVLKRWINSDIHPMAVKLREIAEAYLEGDMQEVAKLLGNPATILSQKEKPLAPLMEWALRGKSQGREDEDGKSTHAEDICLAFMGALVPRLSQGECTLSSGMVLSANAVRDTVQGQFIVSIQGAKAMQAIRERQPETWKQRKSLARIATQMQAQVKPQLLREKAGEIELQTRGHKKVLKVMDYKGDTRRLELLREPDAIDWHVMSLCWEPEKTSATSEHRSLWLGFAGMLLSIAIQTGGWFEVADKYKQARGRKRKTKMLVLSEAAHTAIARDVEKWVGNGFVAEPMLIPPVSCDYLSVKHHKVTGQRPPKGLLTDPEESYAWEKGADTLATSPWQVNELMIEHLREDGFEGDSADKLRIEAHRRLGLEAFYLPVNMDFRGRMYYRTPWVSPQSGDLGKSLLSFPKQNSLGCSFQATKLLHLHLKGVEDKPLTHKAHTLLRDAGQWDRIPIQLDGTCNGLQHLSALLRDQDAAPKVNLCKGGEEPEDVYGEVAEAVTHNLRSNSMVYRGWVKRLLDVGLKVDRALCKGPVMVLPYGGTLEAIRLSIKGKILEQLGATEGGEVESPWHRAPDYEAFRERALADHPLFNQDVTQFAELILSCIKPQIPLAMDAMETFKEIGRWVGTRALSWQTGPLGEKPLWIVQAKSRASRKQVTMKGFQLPDMVRRLTLMSNTNEVDSKSHVSGIVANFIHSLDADHLSRAVATFRARGGGSVGAVHDCVLVRPSEASLMATCLRETFVELHTEDPLSRPVRLIETEGVDEGVITEYDNWHELAKVAGTVFPERGSFDISEVLKSKWFFS